MNPRGTWHHFRGTNEHHCTLECGIQIALFRDPYGRDLWCWRIAGVHDSEPRSTRTNNLDEAKRQAHRGLALFLHLASDQNSAALVLSGTGMGK